jgi:hypothetical protein
LSRCQLEERLGNWGDGGKWICDPRILLRPQPMAKCLVYSIGTLLFCANRSNNMFLLPFIPCHAFILGSNNEFSFENELLKEFPSCEIHTFDMTVHLAEGPIDAAGKIIFHPYGLAPEDSATQNVYSLESIMKRLGHTQVRRSLSSELSVFFYASTSPPCMAVSMPILSYLYLNTCCQTFASG